MDFQKKLLEHSNKVFLCRYYTTLIIVYLLCLWVAQFTRQNLTAGTDVLACMQTVVVVYSDII